MIHQPSRYYDFTRIAALVAAGQHREEVGGKWDQIGRLQIDFLRAKGMAPDSTLLDIGCGSLRLGVQAVGYLNAGHYWGTDINLALLDAGYEKELVPAGLAGILPRPQLLIDGDFDFARIPVQFDFAMAQSLFTHLPVGHLERCLQNLRSRLKDTGVFFATFRIAEPERASQPVEWSSTSWKKFTYPDREPYHFTMDQIHSAARDTGFATDFIGEWGHPRCQQMVAFRPT